MQALDRKLLDAGGPVPDVKLKARRLHRAGHALACHLPTDVVLPVSDAYASWELKRQPVEVLVEVIRVDTVEDCAGRKQAMVTVTYRFGNSTAIGMESVRVAVAYGIK